MADTSIGDDKMCTAVSLVRKNHYFGRNLDLYYNYNERVTVTPRNFHFDFLMTESLKDHYAFIGMATVEAGFPLYYDAANEAGLAIAALNFPENARYSEPQAGKTNIAPFELIPWVLGGFKSVDEVERAVKTLNIVNLNFSDAFPNSPLHWMISDKYRSVVLEPTSNGLEIHQNPLGVLTNNPPFGVQLLLFQQYSRLSTKNPEKTFSKTVRAKPFSLGMGGLGLPGDASSPSRFVRAAFVKENSVCDGGESASVGQFFHILSSVEQQKGITLTDDGELEYTLYSSCINTQKGVYYYVTYENRSITAVDMCKEDLNSSELITYGLIKKENITFQN